MIRDGVKLPEGVQDKIPDLVRSVASDKDIVALFAFGSLARNALKPMSDLDFGVLLSFRLNKNERFEKHIKLIGQFTDFLKTDEIDLIDMNDVPPRIAFQILKTGKLLFCNDRAALIDFRERLIKIYLDFKPVREAFDSVFLKGIGYHGRAD